VVKRYIAISFAVFASYAQVLPDADDRLTLVHYGVPTQELAQPMSEEELLRVRADLRLEDRGPVLINLARLSIAQKDQLTLLRALPIVQEEFPQASLLLVGEGKDRPSIEREIERLGLGGGVTLLGSRQDIGALLAVSDVFVFPSRYEGFGIALAEAMAAGKPVVASRVPPLTELVDEGGSGYLVKPGDPEAFASAIVKLAHDQALARAMGMKGQQIAREKFDIAMCASGWEGIYRAVMGDHRPV
jgi:glycosyltransferase involved in cell wall biosynthesis